MMAKTLHQIRLQDQYKQSWNARVRESSKAVNYRIFKDTFEFENYFDVLNTNECISQREIIN